MGPARSVPDNPVEIIKIIKSECEMNVPKTYGPFSYISEEKGPH